MYFNISYIDPWLFYSPAEHWTPLQGERKDALRKDAVLRLLFHHIPTLGAKEWGGMKEPCPGRRGANQMLFLSKAKTLSFVFTCGFGVKLIHRRTWRDVPRDTPFLRSHDVPLAIATQVPRLQDSAQFRGTPHWRMGLGRVEVVGRAGFWMAAWQCGCRSWRNTADTYRKKHE